MKNTKGIVALVAGVIVASVVSTTYIMKHPNQNNVQSVQSSWLSKEEKDSAIKRIVSLECDKVFRNAFIPGTAVVATGEMNEVTEQSDAYQFLNEVAIIHGSKGYNGSYICTYYKDGRAPVLNVNLKGDGIIDILKK